MSERRENLQVVYNEAVELHKHQQDAIDLVYNKLNWILVSDLVFLAAILQLRHFSILVMLLTVLSALFALWGFDKRKFKITAKLSDQVRLAGEDNFLEGLIERKRQNFNFNEKESTELANLLKYSSLLLMAALILQVLLVVL